MTNYISLHNHTEHSVLDGMFSVEKWLAKANKLKMTALAVTDHGSMGGILQLIIQSKKFEIKPIAGIEFYIVDNLKYRGKESRNHITAFAKTNKGLKNLITLNNIAQRNGFYRKPRIDYKHLLKYKDDIIITSGCIRGYMPQYIIKNKINHAIEHINFLNDNFENVFFEIMLFDTNEHKRLNSKLIELGDKYNNKCIITNDSHYLEQNDFTLQNVILKIKTNKKIDEKSFQFTINDLWFKSYDEIYGIWKEYYKKIFNENKFNEIIKNTNLIQDLVQDYKIDCSYKFFDINFYKEDKCYNDFIKWLHNIKDEKKIIFNI